jgi:tetratricopeptide (TPR) repeat protein
MSKEFFERNPGPIEPGYVFTLLMEKSKDVYLRCVKKAADDLDELRCESFLDLKHPGNALEDILSRIQKAEILVYDVTDLAPNVMWELGVGLTIKEASRVVVIREQSDVALPFNIYNHRVHSYDPTSEDSLTDLHKTLKDVMKKIMASIRKKGPPISPEVKALLETALQAVTKREWIAAEALFQTMDVREPENWFIHNQWGMMLRNKGEIEAAIPKFQQALDYTESNDDKAFIYTELAVLHQKNGKFGEAEEWFKKAEKADSENNRLYIAWAECYDELGDHFSAQAKIGGALARMGKGREGDPNYEELMLRHNYYGKKIKVPTYRKTFEQFKREERLPVSPPSGEWDKNGDRLPYNTSWNDLLKNYLGEVVEGEISNITAQHGIFVKLSREFTGLIFWKNLMEGYGERFSKNQIVKVRISKAFIHPKDQKGRIDLRLIEEH